MGTVFERSKLCFCDDLDNAKLNCWIFLLAHVSRLCVVVMMNNMLIVCKLLIYACMIYININRYENGILHFICTGAP